MDKHGGLDQYLIKTKDEVLGRLGRSLREELRLKLAATQASEGDTGVQALAQLLDRSRVADESSATMARRAEESAALRQ